VRRFSLISAAALAMALALTPAASAVPREIDVGDDFFSPRNPPTRNFSDGASFRWTNGNGTGNRHNIRQDKRLFSSGALTRGPIDFAIRASAGSFHYYCTLHGSPQGGMAGRVKVRPIEVPDSVRGAVDLRWANSNTNTGSRFDVRYRVDRRKWKTWKNDTRSFHALFGRNDRPVNFAPSRHNYKLKVRSERRNVNKRSGWSPVLRFG
jgi:plastocyanin